jgi:hypothetical protein
MNERVGFWMAPLAAAVALVPFFSLPASPWFLGKLTAEAPMSLPAMAAMGVILDGTGSQVVHALQNFRQPGLREFASGWMPSVFGCLCGAVAGLTFILFRKLRIPEPAQPFVYAAPAFTVILCGFLLVNHAHR